MKTFVVMQQAMDTWNLLSGQDPEDVHGIFGFVENQQRMDT